MDTQLLLWVAASAAGSASLGAGMVWWRQARALEAIRTRLEQSEAARNAAVERSRQARSQIAKLQQALSEAKAAQTAAPPAPSDVRQRREELARRLDEAPTLVLPRNDQAASGFADTMPVA